MEQWLLELRRINLNQLVSFSSVAQLRSFRAAASEIHLSQSAISVQVQQLENVLGVKLFHRNTRTVRLTAEGERLSQVVRTYGVQLERVLSQLRAEGRLQHGIITVATLPSLAATFMPIIITNFQSLFPGIKIKLSDVDSATARAMVQQGACDLTISSRPLELPSLRFIPLFREKLRVVVSSTLEDLRLRSTISAKNLSKYPLLLNPRGIALRESVEASFKRQGIDITPSQEVTGAASLVALVAQGVGVTILPPTALASLNMEACHTLQLRPSVEREIGVILSDDYTPSPATEAFMNYLKHERWKNISE